MDVAKNVNKQSGVPDKNERDQLLKECKGGCWLG